MKLKNGIVAQFIDFGIGPAVGALLSAVSVPVTTRLISPEEFGKASLFGICNTVLILLSLLGFDQAYTRFYNEIPDKRKLLSNCLVLPFAMNLLVIIGVQIFGRKHSERLYAQV